MRRTIAIVAFAAAFLVCIAVVVAAPGIRVGTKGVDNSIQSAMSIYDLHVGHPNMKNLPVQEAPLP